MSDAPGRAVNEVVAGATVAALLVIVNRFAFSILLETRGSVDYNQGNHVAAESTECAEGIKFGQCSSCEALIRTRLRFILLLMCLLWLIVHALKIAAEAADRKKKWRTC